MINMLGVVLRQAWQRSEGKCECTRLDHDHLYIRCNRPLVWDRQDKPGGWKPRHRIGYGRNVIAACEILCWEYYQKAT
jgi:hypothetical protein